MSPPGPHATANNGKVRLGHMVPHPNRTSGPCARRHRTGVSSAQSGDRPDSKPKKSTTHPPPVPTERQRATGASYPGTLAQYLARGGGGETNLGLGASLVWWQRHQIQPDQTAPAHQSRNTPPKPPFMSLCVVVFSMRLSFSSETVARTISPATS